ncbi:DUF7544 domain-containing protein [Natrarchaeobius chitinivorans]|uniref:Uncharacterized protein n=1 Tax=Natrarchaeobius chitinivorans TaxID=1679083 RepID=A0A3N6PAJ2_NATCH|nr:hypothetical protein [Natrarchaeobius chitinivorans]RQG93405.1 hypothetical protein EA473_15370 [Natrarchaeobius chitinivorans]
MYAVDNLDDAGGLTKQYLGSLGASGWLKLALVVFVVYALEVNTQLFRTPPDTGTASTALPEWAPLELLVPLVALGVWLAFRYLAALFEFVFVESLRSRSFSIRRYARENLLLALWLLLFRIVLWIGLLLLVAVPVVAVVVLGDVSSIDDVTAGQVVLTAFVALGGFLALWVVSTLTNAFVVPVMLLEDRNPFSAWVVVGSSIRSNLAGTLGFLAVAWVAGFSLWIVFAFVGFFVTMFGGMVFLVSSMMAMESDPALGYIVFALGVLAYFFYLYLRSFVEAPVRSYVRYYALLILGDTEERLDLVPDQRAAIRPGGTTSTAGSTRDDHGRSSRTDDSWDGGGSTITTGTEDAARDDSSDRDGDESASWEGPPAWDTPVDDRDSSALDGGSSHSSDQLDR